MRQFRMVIQRGEDKAPIQTFSHDLGAIRREAAAHLSLLPGKRAVITEITENFVGSVRSYVGPEGLLMYEENFLESTSKLEETGKVTESLLEDSGKEQTQSVNT